MKQNTIKLNESTIRSIVAESVKRVLKEYNHDVEDWWRHNGIYDREQASSLPYNSKDVNYLQKTDEWWESLSDEEKIKVYQEFFEEV